MVAVLRIYDLQNAERPSTPTLELKIAATSITAEALIRMRVEADVEAYRETRAKPYVGLVVPEDAEQTLNGPRVRPGRPVNVERQVACAVEAFKKNGYFMLVGERQIESLEERIELDEIDTVSFVKLVQLVGG